MDDKKVISPSQFTFVPVETDCHPCLPARGSDCSSDMIEIRELESMLQELRRDSSDIHLKRRTPTIEPTFVAAVNLRQNWTQCYRFQNKEY